MRRTIPVESGMRTGPAGSSARGATRRPRRHLGLIAAALGLLLAAPAIAATEPGPQRDRAVALVTARASAMVVSGVAIRQSQTAPQHGPSVQISRKSDREVLVEFH